MARYIDAEKLKEKLRNTTRWIVRKDNAHNEGFTYDQVFFAIDEQPTADVVERKTGEWKCICSTDYWQYTYEHYRCSECGIPAECAFMYCPNCGTRMEGNDANKSTD